MKQNNTYPNQINNNGTPDMNVNDLRAYLQPFFPEHDINELLDYSGLITKNDRIDPLLYHKGFIKTSNRFPRLSEPVLDVTITGQGVDEIRGILQGYTVDIDQAK